AALVPANLPDGVAVWVEAEDLFEEVAARARVGVGAHTVEALEREVARDFRMIGDERFVVRLDDGQLEVEPLRVAEAQTALAAFAVDALARQAVAPELDRILGGHSEDDAVHHAATGAAGTGLRILEEREVAAGAALLVRVEEVVDGRVVLVHGLLHQAEPEY